MMNMIKRLFHADRERVLVTFGEAKLIITRKGETVVLGGSSDDRAAMKEWVSLFEHEIVPRFARG